jgi:hypothetical protein
MRGPARVFARLASDRKRSAHARDIPGTAAQDPHTARGPGCRTCDGEGRREASTDTRISGKLAPLESASHARRPMLREHAAMLLTRDRWHSKGAAAPEKGSGVPTNLVVPLSTHRREILHIPRLRRAPENQPECGGVPHGRGRLLAPALARLCKGLNHNPTPRTRRADALCAVPSLPRRAAASRTGIHSPVPTSFLGPAVAVLVVRKRAAAVVFDVDSLATGSCWSRGCCPGRWCGGVVVTSDQLLRHHVPGVLYAPVQALMAERCG